MTGIVPAPQLQAGLVQRPAPDLVDRAAALGQADEPIGRNQAMLRMVPADQRFGTGHLLRGHADLGLVVQEQLLAANGPAQVGQQPELLFGAVIHPVGEQHEGVAPGFLGLVHRRVGKGHQLALAGGVVGADRHADAGGYLQFVVRQQRSTADRLQDAPGEGWQIFIVLDAHHQHELIAAQARQHVMGAQQLAGALGHRHQQCVTRLVAIGIVDLLEAVQVHEHHREAATALFGLGQCLHDAALQQQAVGQACERIMQCGLGQFLLRIGQRGAQHGVAQPQQLRLHPLVQPGHHQHHREDRDRQHHYQHRQPLVLQAIADRRAADAAFRKACGGHAGVVHANDGQPEQASGCQPVADTGALRAQAEGHIQRSP